MAKLLHEELAQHGSVRPPWILFPGVHPFDIAWRMGAGETHVMLWGAWDISRSERIAAIQKHGAVPADWAWWAGDMVELIGGEDMYDIPFEDVCRQLDAVGITVHGELWHE